MDPIINPSDYTILIVDDNQTNIILLQAILKRAKYNTVSATNGTDALRIMQEMHPDLVLLDIMMPEMDGYEVARRKDEIDLFYTQTSSLEAISLRLSNSW